jgi:hypothetical protein
MYKSQRPGYPYAGLLAFTLDMVFVHYALSPSTRTVCPNEMTRHGDAWRSIHLVWKILALSFLSVGTQPCRVNAQATWVSLDRYSTIEVRSNDPRTYNYTKNYELQEICENDNSDQSECSAFINGAVSAYYYFNDLLMFKERGSDPFLPFFCPSPPHTLSITVIMQIFLNWSHTHPNSLHYTAVSGIFDALVEIFPCDGRK